MNFKPKNDVQTQPKQLYKKVEKSPQNDSFDPPKLVQFNPLKTATMSIFFDRKFRFLESFVNL